MDQEQEDRLLLQLIIQGLEKLDKSMEDLDEKVNGIHVTMARNTESLEAHMARTEIIEEALKPIKSTHDGLIVTSKIIGILALITTIIGGLWTGFKILIGIK